MVIPCYCAGFIFKRNHWLGNGYPYGKFIGMSGLNYGNVARGYPSKVIVHSDRGAMITKAY